MGIEDPDMAHRETDPEGTSNSLLTNTRCCFCFPCFRSRRSSTVGIVWWERVRTAHTHLEHRWWDRGIRALKKIREWSEIVAGPRWKTFIRRFNRNRSSGSGNRHGKFQYDPLSYALNFDEGPGQNANFDDDDDNYSGYPGFSTRWAAVPASSKAATASSLDGSSKDVAVFA